MNRKELLERILEFRNDRDWKQFHDPKNLAGAISVESAELLELFQWIKNEDSEKYGLENIEKVKKEVADVMIYLMYFCNDLGIDIDKAVEEKIIENEKKYPQEKSRGNAKKYTELK